jgi:hypothetical protein
MAGVDIREYRRRLQEANAVIAEEERHTSMKLRLKQANSLYLLAVALGAPLNTPQDEEEERAAWERWARLRGGRT